MNETFPFVTAWLDPGGVKLGERARLEQQKVMENLAGDG